MPFYYFKQHKKDLSLFFLSIKRIFPFLISLLFIAISILAIITFAEIFSNYRQVRQLKYLDPQTLFDISQYLTLLAIYRFLVSYIGLIALFLWAIFWFLVFVLMRIPIGIIYQVFYPVDYKQQRRISLYGEIIDQSLQRTWFFLLIAYLVFSTIFLSLGNPGARSPSQFVRMGALLMIGSVPIILSTIWLKFSNIRRKRRKLRRRVFDTFLFSRSAMRLKLKGTLVGLVFLGLLGTISIPQYFQLINNLSSSYQKVIVGSFENLEFIATYREGNQREEKPSKGKLISKEEIAEAINPISKLGNPKNYNTLIPYLQKYLFLLITIFGLLDIGIPVIYKTVLNKGYRTAITRISLLTIKSTIVVALLSLFIKKAFFIDINDPIGIGIMFSLLLSFFLTQDAETVPLKGQRRSPQI